MKLSKVTIGLGIYIVISAAFMLQFRNWLFRACGDFIVINCFRLCFISAGVFTLLYAFKMRLNLFRTIAIIALFILAYFFSMWQFYFSEKTHVLSYGLLGYCAVNDSIKTKRKIALRNVIFALSFVSLISALDEVFQGILPYRFAEMKDFVTNIISSALGISLFFVLKND